jgi:hypothetical protein
VCDPKHKPTISLAIVTARHMKGADLVPGRLTYVLTWPGVSCSAPLAPAAGPAARSPNTCRLVNLVDAQDGRWLFATEGASH